MTDLPIGQGCLLLPGAADEVTDAHAAQALRQRDTGHTRAQAGMKILRLHASGAEDDASRAG